MDLGDEQGMMGDGGAHLKREHEDDGGHDDGNKRRRAGSGRADGPRIEIRLLIQSKNAGAVIGKGGENIKRLRSDYSASVTVPDSNSPERILSLGAEQDSALDCLLDIIPNLEEYQKYDDLDFDAEIRFLVHQSQAGCVIGRSGAQIKKLRDDTKTNIKVHQDACPMSTDRVVQINGQPKLIVDAVRMIYHLLENAPPKGPINPYDPYNYDEFNIEHYGGYSPFDNRRSGGRGGRGGGGRSSRGGGGRGGGGSGRGGGGGGFRDFGSSSGGFDRNRGGSFGRGGGRFNRDSSSGGFSNRGGGSRDGSGSGFGSSSGGFNQGFNMSGAFGQGGGGGGSGFGGSGGFGTGGGGGSGGNFTQDSMSDTMGEIFDSKTTTQVTIPNDYAGSIIGTRGERIKSIRQQSGTQITIDEAVAGSNDRVITIIGRPENIQTAQFLLQQTVRQYTGKY